MLFCVCSTDMLLQRAIMRLGVLQDAGQHARVGADGTGPGAGHPGVRGERGRAALPKNLCPHDGGLTSSVAMAKEGIM